MSCKLFPFYRSGNNPRGLQELASVTPCHCPPKRKGCDIPVWGEAGDREQPVEAKPASMEPREEEEAERKVPEQQEGRGESGRTGTWWASKYSSGGMIKDGRFFHKEEFRGCRVKREEKTDVGGKSRLSRGQGLLRGTSRDTCSWTCISLRCTLGPPVLAAQWLQGASRPMVSR